MGAREKRGREAVVKEAGNGKKWHLDESGR